MLPPLVDCAAIRGCDRCGRRCASACFSRRIPCACSRPPMLFMAFWRRDSLHRCLSWSWAVPLSGQAFGSMFFGPTAQTGAGFYYFLLIRLPFPSRFHRLRFRSNGEKQGKLRPARVSNQFRPVADLSTGTVGKRTSPTECVFFQDLFGTSNSLENLFSSIFCL